MEQHVPADALDEMPEHQKRSPGTTTCLEVTDNINQENGTV